MNSPSAQQALAELMARAQAQLPPSPETPPQSSAPPPTPSPDEFKVAAAPVPLAPEAPRKPTFLRSLLTNFLGTLAEDLQSGTFAQAVGEGLKQKTKGEAAGTVLSSIPQIREQKRQQKMMEARQRVMDRIAGEQLKISQEREKRMAEQGRAENVRVLATKGLKLDAEGNIVPMTEQELSPEARARAARAALENPIDKALRDAAAAHEKGDTEGFKKNLELAQQLGSARRVTQPNELTLIQKSITGDAEATAALRVLQNRRLELTKERGLALGQGRIQVVFDPETGQTTNMLGYDVLAAQAEGKKLIPAGRLGANVLVAAQRLASEAFPAIEGVKKNLGAFDNAGDRAIFARVVGANPMSGDAHSWLGLVLDQALQNDLSPDGKALIVRLRRLNETVGTLRATLGLPATNSATALTLSLLPGPMTPSAAFAKDQLDQLEQVVRQALMVPAFGGAFGPKSTPAMKVPVYDINGNRID